MHAAIGMLPGCIGCSTVPVWTALAASRSGTIVLASVRAAMSVSYRCTFIDVRAVYHRAS